MDELLKLRFFSKIFGKFRNIYKVKLLHTKIANRLEDIIFSLRDVGIEEQVKGENNEP